MAMTSSVFQLLRHRPPPPLHPDHSISNPPPPPHSSSSLYFSRRHGRQIPPKCVADQTPESEFLFPDPNTEATVSPDKFPIEKRRRSEIIRDTKSRKALVKPEPPNFEIGWKRTKPIQLEKPIGHVIMDFLEKFEALMDREFGSTALLAKVGEIVAERAREEAEVLIEEGKVEDRMVTELFRVLKLMEMDLAMVKAAVKEDTINERLEQAKARCRQAILVANSF